ncbi:MAG: DUF4340 domain-containing protein [Gammaproteobacteria bacterium]|nr:MAG: DUF4340 domain-containing protein [Gammaproteobacteria bacterium]
MFSRRWIINYVLIVLIVVFAYIGNRYDVETGYKSKPNVTGLDAAEIESIEIRTADGSLSLRRDGGGWLVESPIRWPGNNINVERLLDIVNSGTDSRLAADAIDLSTLGLDFPKAMLRLNDTRVLFGTTNNIGERRYTMIGSTVFLLPDVHLPFIIQGLTGFVDRRLLPKKLGLEALRLPGLPIERAGDQWRAAGTDFDHGQLQQLVDNWQGLEASRIKPHRATGTPRQKIEARFADGQTLELYLMSIDPEIVIANPQTGLQYHFSDDLYYQLISLGGDENPA